MCAYNSTINKFFGLESDYATTSPIHVDHPYYAVKHIPYSFENYDEYFSEIRPAPYYFENSSRMREWLEGFEMVVVEMNIDYRILK